jgi:hypothetical protein
MVFNGQLFLWLTVAFISTSKSMNRLTHFYVVKSAAVGPIGEKPEIQSLKIYKQKFLHMRLSLKKLYKKLYNIRNHFNINYKN